MKNIFITLLVVFTTITSTLAQDTRLPEFNDKPAFYNSDNNELVDLEKSQYNILTKAKGLFKGEGGFFLNGSESIVRIENSDELKFVIKVTSGTDPTSIVDLVEFEVRGDQRVFITTRAKAYSSTTSYEKINYSLEKIQDGYYYLVVKNIDSGEYFLGSAEFMFAFGVE